MPKSPFWERLDIKVYLIVILTVVASATAVFVVVFSLSYSFILGDIKERSATIASYVSNVLDREGFLSLNERKDESSEVFVLLRDHLNSIREAASIKYLYTVKKNPRGDYIYVVDGFLKDDTDFRHIGDYIENEIVPHIAESYEGVTVYSDDIINTEWGNVFLSYWPIFGDNEEVIGVIGMEFNADSIITSYNRIRLFSICISAGILLVFILLSNILFKKLSEPYFKRLAYTDFITGIKNRTAFELDLKSLEKNMKSNLHFSIVVVDLDNLKTVNDSYGHSYGDEYIIDVASALKQGFSGFGETYRIGGDEFAVVVFNKSENAIERVIEEIRSVLSNMTVTNTTIKKTFSYGIATYNKVLDSNLHSVLNKADNKMYEMKKLQKQVLEYNR